MAVDDKFIMVPFLRSSDLTPTLIDLVINNIESSTDETFDLTNIWMNVTIDHTLGGPSNVEDISALSVENIVSNSTSLISPKTVSFTNLMSISSPDEDTSMVSNEGSFCHKASITTKFEGVSSRKKESISTALEEVDLRQE